VSAEPLTGSGETERALCLVPDAFCLEDCRFEFEICLGRECGRVMDETALPRESFTAVRLRGIVR